MELVVFIVIDERDSSDCFFMIYKYSAEVS